MKSRRTVQLGEKFNKRWLGYATAASGAAVGLLATTRPAMADIIYYPSAPVSNCYSFFACQQLEMEGSRGGVNVIFAASFFTTESTTVRHLTLGRAYVGSRGLGILSRSGPLRGGAEIGPVQPFTKVAYMFTNIFLSCPSYCTRTHLLGPWNPNKSGYLGFEFTGLDEQVHFGWVHVSVRGGEFIIGAAAYNTVADQPIRAGQTTLTAEPGTLGLLALGSLGLGFWRRRKAVGTTTAL